MKHIEDIYDLCVIGGGPAGMMAAGRAAELGARTVLLEQNLRLGTKLMMTGHGRCNLTNDIDNRTFVERLGSNGRFLYSALGRFGIPETLTFFEQRGLQLKTEKEQRVFPLSGRAGDVLNVLERYLRDGKVSIKLGAQVRRFVERDGRIEKVTLENGQEVVARKFIFATGGKSYPAAGAKGDGYKWTSKLGHRITDLYPALSPIVLQEPWIKSAEGAPLLNIELTLVDENGRKLAIAKGDGVITANGFSGPVAHDLAHRIGIEQKAGRILRLRLNLLPTEKDIDSRLRRQFEEQGGLMLKSHLGKFLPPKLLPLILGQSGIDPELFVSRVNKTQRRQLAQLLSAWEFKVKGVVGYDKAIVTAGGVALAEVDPLTMKSKLIDNLFLAGELLDLAGPTGGFNLQICWTTGFVAGEAAALN